MTDICVFFAMAGWHFMGCTLDLEYAGPREQSCTNRILDTCSVILFFRVDLIGE